MSNPIDEARDRPTVEVSGLPLAPRPTFAAGETVPGLSSWVLERKLGGGGFGEVWLARHAWDAEQKPRAVKFCTDPAAKNRLVTHERNVVLRVMKYAGKHPNVVPLLDCNLDGDVPWLMYEFVEDGTLADAMKEWRNLPLPKRLGRTVRVLHAVAGALGTFHRFDPPLVHRDMKPHNVLMAGGTVPRITDFGIGSVVVREDGPTTGALTAYAARLPAALHNAGTRLYAPAEQLFGSPPNPRDDVYALGVIAYQMVTADLTAVPGTDAEPELRALTVPGELASLIVRSVAVNPDRRPADAAEWEAALAAVIDKARDRPAASSGGASTPAPLPEEADDPDDPQPRFAAPGSEGSSLEPTAGPAARTGPSPLPPPLPEPLPVAEPGAGRVPRSVRRGDEPEPSGKRKGLVLALGGVLVLGLAVAIVVAALPPGKRSEPSGPPESVEVPPNTPPGDVPEAKGGDPKVGPADPKGVPPKDVPAPKPGETREIEIAPGVKMTFCWIPPGKATLGSPEGEKERWDVEAEHEYTSKGFWMGKYEVTQAEWKAVMGDNPSRFDGKKDNKAKGLDTSRFPVESVTRDRICGEGEYVGKGFLNKVNAHGGVEKAFGKPGTVRLPTGDEWEYACRGGGGNKQPFYWGGKLNGTEANANGKLPYGTTTKGPSLERPCAVDYTNDGKYAAHPWGLMHMHGNVSEWCENVNDKIVFRYRYVLRGGDWNLYAHTCRAAYPNPSAPNTDLNGFHGFRLIVPGLP